MVRKITHIILWLTIAEDEKHIPKITALSKTEHMKWKHDISLWSSGLESHSSLIPIWFNNILIKLLSFKMLFFVYYIEWEKKLRRLAPPIPLCLNSPITYVSPLYTNLQRQIVNFNILLSSFWGKWPSFSSFFHCPLFEEVHSRNGHLYIKRCKNSLRVHLSIHSSVAKNSYCCVYFRQIIAYL